MLKVSSGDIDFSDHYAAGNQEEMVDDTLNDMIEHLTDKMHEYKKCRKNSQ